MGLEAGNKEGREEENEIIKEIYKEDTKQENCVLNQGEGEGNEEMKDMRQGERLEVRKGGRERKIKKRTNILRYKIVKQCVKLRRRKEGNKR